MYVLDPHRLYLLKVTRLRRKGERIGDNNVGLFDKKNSNNASDAKLGELLKQAFPDVEFFKDEGGPFVTREESVMVSIFVNKDYGDGTNVVSVVGLTIFGARDEDALYRHLLTNTDGHIQASWVVEVGETPGTVNIMSVQNLLLNSLDAIELEVAVRGVVSTANENDEIIQKLFGGKRCVEQYQWDE